MISASRRDGRLLSLVRFGGAGTVALGSAVISYGHVQDVLAAWGYNVLAAHVGPLVLDGLMSISGFALLAMTSPADARPPASTAPQATIGDVLPRAVLAARLVMPAAPVSRSVRWRWRPRD
jgi:hypothetical protein